MAAKKCHETAWGTMRDTVAAIKCHETAWGTMRDTEAAQEKVQVGFTACR
jgi:hypothetical protein